MLSILIDANSSSARVALRPENPKRLRLVFAAARYRPEQQSGVLDVAEDASDMKSSDYEIDASRQCGMDMLERLLDWLERFPAAPPQS